MSGQEVPDPAATVVLLRPEGERFEVLMVERPDRGFFGGLVVFPGGRVDDEDSDALAHEAVSGGSFDQAHRSAALRELAEETGLAATVGGMTSIAHDADVGIYRQLLGAGRRLDGEALALISRWVTPEGAPRRFDTRFYLLGVTNPPEVRLATAELVGSYWITPESALERYQSGDWKMFLPTIAHLRWLAKRTDIEDAFDSARGADGRTAIEPRRAEDGSLVPIHLPADL